MADDRRELRASDKDRQETVDRLRVALDEGRLNMDEYLERMGLAYEAVTYDDLAKLNRDLPDERTQEKPAPPPAPAPPPTVAQPVPVPAREPDRLKMLWRTWMAVVGVSAAIWALVSLLDFQLTYFWPVWVIVPTGAVLLGATLSRSRSRRP